MGMRTYDKGVRDDYRARKWLDFNPSARDYMIALAVAEAEAGRDYSMKWLVEQARKKDFTNAAGKPFRGVDNTLTAALSRIFRRHLLPVHVAAKMTPDRSASVDLIG